MTKKETELADDKTTEALFSAIARRDPSKRQIKPVINQLPLFDDLEDDSDSEFVCDEKDDEDESDDDIDESEEDSGSTDSEEESNSDASRLESGTAQSPSDLKSGEEKNPTVLEEDSALDHNVQATVSLDQEPCTIPINGQEAPLSEAHMDDLKKEKPQCHNNEIDMMVCMVCLGDNDDTHDELIECDGCGIVVHEDCYKVVDSVFLSSGASSSSTDAWFCEPCLAGVRSPYCELCPNLGGVFKRTDNNRWVHLLCALYTPGVAFDDTENLMDVTLTELPSRVWSQHECSLCEERFFAWTGVCIPCDAGLCRTFFHVTCAQKHGLLSEPSTEESAADPFFAQCRQHTDKTVARQRRRNYLTAMSRLKKRQQQHQQQQLLQQQQQHELQSQRPFEAKSPTLYNVLDMHPSFSAHDHHFVSDPRIERKLENFRSLYSDLLMNREKPFVPNAKSALFLETSPVAMRLFLTKAKALQLPMELTGSSATTESAKAPPSGYPLFAPEFITYFFEREKKISEVSKRISALKNTQRELQLADANASHSYNSVSAQLDGLHSKRNGFRSSFQEIISSLQKLIPELKPAPPLEAILVEPKRMPDGIKVDEKPDDPKLQPQFSQSNQLRAISSSGPISGILRGAKRKGLSPRGSLRPNKRPLLASVDRERVNPEMAGQPGDADSENVILGCFVCHGLQDQHLITKCDTCGKAFHLACLDPPLLRMPKRSRLYGWQCSICTKAVAVSSEVILVDVNAPRQLRHSSTKPLEPSNPPVAVENTKPQLPPSSESTQLVPVVEALTDTTVVPSAPSAVVCKSAGRRRGGLKASGTIRSRVGNRATKIFPLSTKRKRATGIKASAKRRGGKRGFSSKTSTFGLNPVKPVDFQRQLTSPVLSSFHSSTTDLPAQPTILVTQVDSVTIEKASKSAVSVPEQSPIDKEAEARRAKSLEAYDYPGDTNSDEEIARLRTSKVIKFVQIQDHGNSGDSSSVEQIAPLHMRYVICRDSGGSQKLYALP
ncbi:unnamed protein product [Calicophoron daubneyi]|uniref:PHD finger protein 14 n=2 Tax=Calicophoron daubneyi TaxID=300641 RepID=A0AAV2TPS5_CALDB